MLVYANSFRFDPAEGPEQIIQLVARWVGQRSKSAVNGARLAEGVRELRLRDGSTLSSRVTLSESKAKIYPYLFCVQLSHRDDKVAGRKWVTEIGLRQESQDQPVECSLLLRTEEMSARVVAPIQVTRPKLVEQLISSCNPLGQTPGLNVKRLTQESASAFLHEVDREERNYPIVVLSASREGHYCVEPERLRSVLVGLADVVCVPVSENTFAIEEVVGRRYMAFGGAINIIFPARDGARGVHCESVLLLADDLDELVEGGNSVESEVLAVITHRTNVPCSWRHISPEKVGQAALRAQLVRMIERARTSDHAEELSEYIALLESADEELRGKDEELARLREAYEERDQQARTLEAKVTSLEHAFSGRLSNESGDQEAAEALMPVRDSLEAVLTDNPGLQQVLDLIGLLYSDRVVILESAKAAAKESDRGGFRHGRKALDLLWKLVTDYWECLAEGMGDQQGKAVFGQNGYAANESSVLSSEGKRRRTFNYRGRDLLMEKHLKHGIKDSVAETLRVHFEWLPSESKIVIGHCGKHLNF